MIYTILVLLAGLVLLILGGDFLVRGASGIALRAKITPLVVGLTVVAFGTSAPELLVSLKAALAGTPDIAIGNVVGSNICNLALVLGLTAVIRPIGVNKDSLKFDWPMTMGASLLLYFLVLDGWVNTLDGTLFVAILILFTFFIIRKSRKETKATEALEDLDIPAPSGNPVKDYLFVLLGGVGLYFGAEWFVGSSVTLAAFLGVSERVISITVVALGTSLPELFTSVIASIKKETDMAVGNLVGSNIFNILSILGITSIVTQIEVNELMRDVDMVWMLAITALILPMMLTRRTVSRLEGGVLLTVYVVYTYSVVS
ncbi:calcium/sodium antiporter [Nafulsella turpanensis]|uniref:calcium/sodium antiporter n=1 Tax=Nafulsella turpanensis TaxID=1265690 RepID=UPI00047623E3|nr:calcium/sodium antiporter [Nafulsella turpanensis]